IPPEVAKYRKPRIQQVFRTGKPIRFVDQRQGRWFDNNIYPVFNKEGKVERVAIFARDITDIKKAELDAADLLNAPRDPAVLVDKKGTILALNASAAKLVKKSIEELVGKCLFDIIPPEKGTPNRFLQVFRTGNSMQFEREINGRYFDVTLYPIFDHNHKVIRVAAYGREITDRKMAESELNRAHQIYQQVIQNAQGVPYYRKFDCEHYEFLGEGIKELVGIPPQKLTYKKFKRLIKERIVMEPGAPTDPVEYSKAVLDGKFNRYWVDLKIITPQGKVKWINDCAVLLRDEQTGKPVGSVGILQDVTLRRQMEHNLRDSEERYRRLVELAPIPIVVHTGGKIVFANPTALKMIGATKPEQILGKPVLDFVHPDYHRLVKARIRQMIKDGKHVPPMEEKLIRLDGQIIDAEITSIPIIYNNKPSVQLVCRDITERKQMEEALRQAEAKYRSLVEQIPAVVYIAALTRTSTTLYVSPQVKNILGFSPEDYKADPEIWSKQLHPEDYKRVMAEVKQRRANGKLLSIEYRMLTKDGRVVWFQDNAELIRDARGKPLFLQGVMIDITQRKQAEEELKKYQQQLEALIEERTARLAEAKEQLEWEILEHKKLTDELITLKARLEHLLTSTTVIVYSAKPGNEPGTTFVSKNIKRILGYTPAEVTADPHFWSNTIHPDDLQFVQDEIARLSANKPVSLEYRLRHKNGTYRWIHDEIRLICDEDQQPREIVGCIIDITERKQAERTQELLQRLSHQLNKQLALQEIGPLVARVSRELFHHDAFWFALYDEAHHRLIGMYSEDTPPEGKEPSIIDTEPSVLNIDTSVIKVLRGKQYLLNRREEPSDSGLQRFGCTERLSRSLMFVPIRAEDRIIGILSVQSYTPNLYSQSDLQLLQTFADQCGNALRRVQLENYLRQSEERYRSTLDSFPDAVHVIDSDFRIILFNKAFKDWVKQLGLDARVIGKTIFEAFPFLTDKVRGEYQQVFKTGEIMITEEMTRIGNKDFFTETRKIPIIENGKVLFIVTIIKDITPHKQAEVKLQQLNQELAERLEALNAINKELKAFSYSASHELRAPLQIISNTAKHLLRKFEDKLGVNGQQLVQRIAAKTKLLRQLIDNLLALSHLDSQELKPAELDMTHLAKTVFLELKSLNPERNLLFELESLPPAQADLTMIREVFGNLLSNAIKFTRNKETAVIKVGGWSEPEKNVYYVKDNGIGFNMKDASKLFNVFQRLHTEEEFEGTGVGLALVKRILQRHGGEVWAEGKINEGATFFFSLPKIKPAE
ncbi:MAG: PAS domain S-box protein, partial [Candidatus Sumerlaeia bacterium]|nr:PAS domain S-box protein [Candidatus Sumerlaeia bacterium]